MGDIPEPPNLPFREVSAARLDLHNCFVERGMPVQQRENFLVPQCLGGFMTQRPIQRAQLPYFIDQSMREHRFHSSINAVIQFIPRQIEPNDLFPGS